MIYHRQTVKVSGFTLVELLVVIAIVGVLISLLLPAIQAARESARQAQCKSHLKQISLGVLHHEETRGYFPYGGWGHEWVGIAGRGSQAKQPGGWVYNTLPYLELGDLHALGGSPTDPNAGQRYARRLTTPICLFNCTTRRSCSTWPVSPSQAYLAEPKPAGRIEMAARGDYAINGGASHVFFHPGPVDLEQGDDSATDWPNAQLSTGISHLRFGAQASQVEDGLSHTYLLGEKFLNPDHYADGESLGDNETLYSGYASDLHRFTRLDLVPLQDTSRRLITSRGELRFGSAHPGGCHMAMCDGSVRFTSYDIEDRTHYYLGHRADLGAEPDKSP
ncbi:MAG: DUF1559 domain-containing protein [Planctomycetota bacterium]